MAGYAILLANEWAFEVEVIEHTLSVLKLALQCIHLVLVTARQLDNLIKGCF